MQQLNTQNIKSKVDKIDKDHNGVMQFVCFFFLKTAQSNSFFLSLSLMLATLMLKLILKTDDTKAIFLPRRVSFILNKLSFSTRGRVRRVILLHFKGLPFQAPFVN